MTVSPRILDTTGNHQIEDGIQLSWDAMTNVAIPVATQPSIVAGTGAPTFTAPKGTLYINLTGSSSSTRLYVNSTGSTTWVNVTTSG